MAMPVENSVTSTITRLLNLNAIDTNAYEEAFEEYFGERDDSENELSSDADEFGLVGWFLNVLVNY